MTNTSRRPVILHVRHSAGAAPQARLRLYAFDRREARLSLRDMSLGVAALGFGFALAFLANPFLPF